MYVNIRRQALRLLTWNGLTGFAQDLEKKEQINHLPIACLQQKQSWQYEVTTLTQTPRALRRTTKPQATVKLMVKVLGIEVLSPQTLTPPPS